jgi:hypothetical protein
VKLSQLALFVPAICLAQAPGQPKLVLDSTDFDFGKIDPDATVSHRFKASNAGNGPLTISRLSPSCGCTSTLAGKNILAPGESTELEITFNSYGQSGSIRKSVTVFSDDPSEPTRTLTFEAEVKPYITVTPDHVLFRDLARTDRRKTSVRLSSETGRAIQVNDVSLSTAPWLGVATREVGNDLWVDLDLLARKLPPGKLTGTDTIALRLFNPQPSIVNLRVTWELRVPVISTPAQVAWAEPAGQTLRAFLKLKSRDRQPFRIVSTRTSNPMLTVAEIKPGAAVQHDVQVLLSSEAKPGVYEEKAFLTLDTPGHPEFEIRVSASLR